MKVCRVATHGLEECRQLFTTRASCRASTSTTALQTFCRWVAGADCFHDTKCPPIRLVARDITRAMLCRNIERCCYTTRRAGGEDADPTRNGGVQRHPPNTKNMRFTLVNRGFGGVWRSLTGASEARGRLARSTLITRRRKHRMCRLRHTRAESQRVMIARS